MALLITHRRDSKVVEATYQVGRVTLLTGDCKQVLATMPANTFDGIVTDPP